MARKQATENKSANCLEDKWLRLIKGSQLIILNYHRIEVGVRSFLTRIKVKEK